jgi:hypothetical protein
VTKQVRICLADGRAAVPWNQKGTKGGQARAGIRMWDGKQSHWVREKSVGHHVRWEADAGTGSLPVCRVNLRAVRGLGYERAVVVDFGGRGGEGRDRETTKIF